MSTEVLGTEQECRVYDRDEWYSVIDYVLFLKHKRAYLESLEDARGKAVLDFGCGSGYGASLLAETAASVVGVDASDEALRAAETYVRPNLTFQKIAPDYTLPFDDDSFDLVTSHQVIEHIPDVERYLRLLKRVLKPGGHLVVSTPNRRFRLLPFQMIWQEAHVREYSEAQLVRDISRVFDRFEMKGIVGSDRAHAAYMAHYQQTPMKAYVKQPIKMAARKLLSRSAYARIRDALGLQHKTPSAPVSKDVLGEYTIDDILIIGDTDRALDFFVTCTK